MGRPLKILSVGHSYVVAMNRGILRELATDENYDVTIIAPQTFKGSLRTIEAEPEPEGSRIRLQTVPAYMTQKMHIFSYDHFQLKKKMQADFDVLHIWEEPYIFAGFQVARFARQLKIPFCMRTAQSLIKKYPYPFRLFEKKVFGWCERWVAGGQLVFDAMTQKGWNSGGQGQILTLAVDTQKFLPFDDLKKSKGVKSFGLKGPLLGYLGRLSEEKGLDLLMEALAAIKSEPWSFLAMGSGSYKEKLMLWAQKEGLQDRVRVELYTHNQIPEILPLCDLLLCPSQTRSFWKEQFGRMIVEGFAAGVPVVASDSGEIPRVVGEAGVILPEADTEAWRGEILRLLRDSGARRELRAQGLQRGELFSAQTLAEQYKVFYQEMVQASAKKKSS